MTEELDNNRENEEMEPVPKGEVASRPLPYANDPAYKDLLKHYQNADWDACLPVIDSLLQTYPEDEGLLEFQHEIQMRNSLLKLSLETETEDKKEHRKKLGTQILIGLGIFVVFFVVAFWAYSQYQARVTERNNELAAEALAAQLTSMNENAESFLEGGHPDRALDLFIQIQELDSEYEGIEEKIAAAEEQVALEDKYVAANQLYTDGDLEGALALFQEIFAEDSRYKNVPLLITKIENTIAINELMIVAQNAFLAGEWLTVVNSADQILEIDANADVSSLDLALFTSYRNLVIETADKPDVTLDEVEKAYEYYRKGLAIFPQDKQYEREREELQQTAISLLANRYLLYAQDLIETENFSQQAVEKALEMLTRANNIGSGSPAIASEIRVLTLYLSAIEDFNNYRWDSAINSLDELKSSDENYANGMVSYLLFEAYLSRGSTLSSYGEYTLASSDFDKAEILARGNYGNTMRIFVTQLANGDNLRRLSLTDLAANIYRYAADLVNFVDKLGSSYPDQLSTYREADAAFGSGDYWNAARLYQLALEDTSMVYDTVTITAKQGDMVGLIAFQNGSTVGAILQFNPQLGTNLVIRSDMEIQVPVLAQDSN